MPKKTLPPSRINHVVVTVRMPVELVQALDRLGTREDRSRSKVIEIAAQRYVEAMARKSQKAA